MSRLIHELKRNNIFQSDNIPFPFIIKSFPNIPNMLVLVGLLVYKKEINYLCTKY